MDFGPSPTWSAELLHQVQSGASLVSESSTLSQPGTGYAAIVLLAPASPLPASNSPAYVDWNTFGFNLARWGYNPNEVTLSATNVASLKLSWSTDLHGAIAAQPIVATDVPIGGTPQTVVYVGAENGVFYALNADTGAIIWQQTLAVQPVSCIDLGPERQFGITGTATFDRTKTKDGIVYVPDASARIHALDMVTGQEAPGWPVSVSSNGLGAANQDYIYGALALNNGLLYVETASICEVSPWHGRIVAIDTASASVVTSFFPSAPDEGGGIWGMGGASIDTSTNDVFVATANAVLAPQAFGYSDAIVQLSAQLNPLAFATSNVIEVDQDYGATPVLYQFAGCPAKQISAKDKDGKLYTYRVSTNGSGSVQQLQLVQALQVASPSTEGAFIGVPAFDPVTNFVYLGSPSDSGQFQHGLIALQNQSSCTGLGLAWQATLGPNTAFPDNESPTVANGVVYFTTGIGNQVFAFNAATGTQLWNSGSTITGPVLAAPTVDGRLYVGSWDHKLYAFGL
jgi:outer membrane protein assembly factor BamB